ncbi:unnamed protein product [Scytosiphon promiscuus]
MSSFSSEDGAGDAHGARSAPGANGCSVFVGSFNINSQDLTIDDARAWLKEAKHADIIALGLQECATVPAKPFPEPTNGKAIARWKDVKAVAVPAATQASGCHTGGNGGTSAYGGRDPPTLAGVVQSAMLEALGVSREAEQARTSAPPSHEVTAEGTIPAFGEPGSSCSSARCDGNPKKQRQEIAKAMAAAERALSSEIDCSTPVMLGDAQRGNGDGGDGGGDSTFGSKGTSTSTSMRQESYYLRGPIEPERDETLLATIAACIPGRSLVADVAMGETPTHGKIKVNISRNVSSDVSSRDVSSSSSSTTASAVEAALAASCCSRQSSGDVSDIMAGDGPLDASGRPGWSAGDSGKGGLGLDANGSADNIDAVFKTVEWYGTIRLLVYVKSGLYKDLSVRTVVIPAGDKPSVVADAPSDYAKDTSPDKGAVACYLEDLSRQSSFQLLLVNCHLYGTNKYGVREAVFDKYRMAQLHAIDLALQATLPIARTSPLVLLGDLNFRVELRSGAEDKTKGGNDFKGVREMAETVDPKVLLDLYDRADRLRPLLEGGSDEDDGGDRDSPFTKQREDPCAGTSGEDQRVTAMPSFLVGLTDGLKQSLAKGQAVRPTFTFKPGDTSSTPRRYNDKRTPSWTDRILWRGFTDDECHQLPDQQNPEDHYARQTTQHIGDTSSGNFAAVQEVITSDHEPVYCVLDLPPPSEMIAAVV